MPFNTANSSFIFDLRRLSIRLCAVFLAIFLPAALVAEGCFFFPEAVPVDACPAALLPPDALAPELAFSAGLSSSSSSSFLGFIWMIFLDLVGGGGSSNVRASLAFAAEDRRRDLTVSLGCTGNPPLPARNLPSVGGDARAGGGSSKDIWRGGTFLVPSLPGISVEEEGVGGRIGGGIGLCGLWGL